MRVILFSIISISFAVHLFAQDNNGQLVKAEEQLNQVLTQLRSTKDKETIDQINTEFKKDFKEALEINGAFDYPFSSLKSIGDIRSDDGLVRIFSWNVQFQDLSNDYFSFILKKDKRRGDVDVIELKRQDQHIRLARNETIDKDNWYGALYYDIIDVEKRNRTFYTLLGYDFNTQRSTIKFIDVLYFTGSTPHLGYPLFKNERERYLRVLFEYSNDAIMSLRYDNDRDLIIFDHLSPKTSKLKEFREFYVPDMSYDAYIWDGKYWNLKEDIIANNKASSEHKQIELKAYDADIDTVVSVTEKSNWLDPTDPNAPIDGGQHRAVTPEDLKKENEGKDPNKIQKDRRNAVQPSRRSKSKQVSYSHLNDRLDKKRKKKKRKKDKKKNN